MYQDTTFNMEDAANTAPLSGLPVGTTVLTKEGELPVELLSPGDRVITRDAGFATLKSIKIVQGIDNAVRFKAGSLGHNKPETDMTLPAGQTILVRDWRAPAMFNASQSLATASQLVDGEFVTDAGVQEMTLVHLTFDRPHILYAGGMEVTSAQLPAAGSTENAASVKKAA
jgi:hypothetical protein